MPTPNDISIDDIAKNHVKNHEWSKLNQLLNQSGMNLEQETKLFIYKSAAKNCKIDTLNTSDQFKTLNRVSSDEISVMVQELIDSSLDKHTPQDSNSSLFY